MKIDRHIITIDHVKYLCHIMIKLMHDNILTLYLKGRCSEFNEV